jgi:putative hydrolase of the HAD superfamily
MYDTLVSLIREFSSPLAPAQLPPLPPDFEALLYRPDAGGPPFDAPIRAVLFDIYGTLFVSAAGDIGTNGGTMQGSLEAMGLLDDIALQFGQNHTGGELKAYFRSAVLKTHEELSPKTAYPEVRVEEIWAAFLKEASASAVVSAVSKPEAPVGPELPAISPEELAIRYELAVNPVYPMPGALEAIRSLKAAGIVLGLVSNAQFFTPLLFDAFFGASPADLGFDPGLLIYSYEAREAKPSPVLFSQARSRLSSLGITAESVLYVGNDLLNDIYAATSSGFKTLLFAGDGHSLRLRKDNRLTANTRPTAVIRSLTDISAICGDIYSESIGKT